MMERLCKGSSDKLSIAIIARIVFFVLVAIQCIILAAYVRLYSPEKSLIILVFLCLIVIVPWTVLLCRWKEQFFKLWIPWALYVIVFAFFVVWICGFLREKLDKKNFWGPNNLKITLCMAPVIAIVLLATADDSQENYKVMHHFHGGLVLELFDALEVLTIVISPEDVAHSSPSPAYLNASFASSNCTSYVYCANEDTTKLPDALVGTMISFVVASLLLSPLDLAEIKLGTSKESKDQSRETENSAEDQAEKLRKDEVKRRKKVHLSRLIAKKLVVNFALMIVRLIAWLKYSHEASIFIVKNATIVVVAFIGILRDRKCCGLRSFSEKAKDDTI